MQNHLHLRKQQSIGGSEGDAVGTDVESSSPAKTTTKSSSTVKIPVSMCPVIAIACASYINSSPYHSQLTLLHTRNK